MYTIQYESVSGPKMESFDGNRRKLVDYLARFKHPILAVYEQATPVTKSIRSDLVTAARSGLELETPAIKTFIMEGMRLTTPA